jgi:hypothetical protein
MLWRKNITEDQAQPATYNVYRNANAYIDVADNPAPYTPGPISPDGSQGSIIFRENLTLIGNEGSNSFNKADNGRYYNRRYLIRLALSGRSTAMRHR